MIDTTSAEVRLVCAKNALLAAQSEVEAAQIALDNVNAINESIEGVADYIRRIIDGYKEAQRRRLDAMLAVFKPEEWAEQASNFVPESLHDWLSGKTIVSSSWIIGRFNRLRKTSSGNITLWGFANDLIEYMPKDDSAPPLVIRRSDVFSIEIAFAAIDEAVNTTP